MNVITYSIFEVVGSDERSYLDIDDECQLRLLATGFENESDAHEMINDTDGWEGRTVTILPVRVVHHERTWINWDKLPL